MDATIRPADDLVEIRHQRTEPREVGHPDAWRADEALGPTSRNVLTESVSATMLALHPVLS